MVLTHATFTLMGSANLAMQNTVRLQRKNVIASTTETSTLVCVCVWNNAGCEKYKEYDDE